MSFAIYTISVSNFGTSQRKDLVLLNLSSRYMTSASQQFFKSKDIVHLFKLNFCVSKLFIQCNRISCFVNIIDGVNMSLYVCFSLYLFWCVSSMCLCVYVMSIQSTSKSHVIRVKPLVNVMLCCIKHIVRCCWH